MRNGRSGDIRAGGDGSCAFHHFRSAECDLANSADSDMSTPVGSAWTIGTNFNFSFVLFEIHLSLPNALATFDQTLF